MHWGGADGVAEGFSKSTCVAILSAVQKGVNQGFEDADLIATAIAKIINNNVLDDEETNGRTIARWFIVAI